MRYHDLQEARLYLVALKELFLEPQQADAATLRRICTLCGAAHVVLNDAYCSLRLAVMAERAATWCSRPASERPQLYLDQLLDLLDLLESRILTIEVIRRASGTSITH
jgi:hypothetical protein